MDERQVVAMTAAMEGEAVSMRNIGDKVELSQMELTLLATFARLGVMSVFGAMPILSAERSIAEWQATTSKLYELFSQGGQRDGLRTFVQSAVAVLKSERVEPYVIVSGQAEIDKAQADARG